MTGQDRAPSISRPHSLARVGAELFAASFVVLFQELTLIRWLPARVRVLAYFPNLILMSSFLGLGLGCLSAGKRSLRWLWPVLLSVLAVCAGLLGKIVFTQGSAGEHLWLLYYDLPKHAPIVGDVRGPLVLFFLLSALSFVPLGQLVARLLGLFRAQGRALWGYACDLLGSLAGVLAFAAASFARLPPQAWFSVMLAAGATFFIGRRRTLLLYGAFAVLLLTLLGRADPAQHYSPYYAVTAVRNPNGSLDVLTNGSLHQYAYTLRRAAGNRSADEHAEMLGYHLPYRFLARPPGKVLVLGAGAGNDVAVALDEGADRVDAVEIDPVILGLGSGHPDRPYDSPQVRQINADARAFLNESKEKYDLIVFGTLDSMTRLSALSSVRLDSFVYTLEGLEAAKARLAPEGGMVLYFMVPNASMYGRLHGLLTRAFGAPPAVAKDNYFLFNTIFMAGPAFAAAQAGQGAAGPADVERFSPRAELPTDDWPFLYLRRRAVDGFHLSLLAVLAGLAVASVAMVSRDMRGSMAAGRMDGEMFLLGFGFLLLEVKSVTAMSLLWGATWVTSAVIFGVIIAMGLFATVLTQLRPLPWSWCVGGLIASLLVGYAVPVSMLLRLDFFARLWLSLAFVGTPVFFAAAWFALAFGSHRDVPTAFGWNLLGAFVGGLSEFMSMITGNRALYLLVLAGYAGAALLHLRSRARPSADKVVGERPA